jgi:hypothetical protein
MAVLLATHRSLPLLTRPGALLRRRCLPGGPSGADTRGTGVHVLHHGCCTPAHSVDTHSIEAHNACVAASIGRLTAPSGGPKRANPLQSAGKEAKLWQT